MSFSIKKALNIMVLFTMLLKCKDKLMKKSSICPFKEFESILFGLLPLKTNSLRFVSSLNHWPSICVIGFEVKFNFSNPFNVFELIIVRIFSDNANS